MRPTTAVRPPLKSSSGKVADVSKGEQRHLGASRWLHAGGPLTAECGGAPVGYHVGGRFMRLPARARALRRISGLNHKVGVRLGFVRRPADQPKRSGPMKAATHATMSSHAPHSGTCQPRPHERGTTTASSSPAIKNPARPFRRIVGIGVRRPRPTSHWKYSAHVEQQNRSEGTADFPIEDATDIKRQNRLEHRGDSIVRCHASTWNADYCSMETDLIAVANSTSDVSSPAVVPLMPIRNMKDPRGTSQVRESTR